MLSTEYKQRLKGPNLIEAIGVRPEYIDNLLIEIQTTLHDAFTNDEEDITTGDLYHKMIEAVRNNVFNTPNEEKEATEYELVLVHTAVKMGRFLEQMHSSMNKSPQEQLIDVLTKLAGGGK